jgi:two-component system response regulator DctR
MTNTLQKRNDDRKGQVPVSGKVTNHAVAHPYLRAIVNPQTAMERGLLPHRAMNHQDGQRDVTLYIVNDDEDIRHSMVAMFAVTHGFRVQLFSDAQAFLKNANLMKPHCVLLNFNRGDEVGGSEVHNALIQLSSPFVVLFFSVDVDLFTAMEARDKGVFGWVIKDMPADKLRATIFKAMQEAQARMLCYDKRASVIALLNQLSPRKNQAAQLIRNGWPNKVVAREMNISVRVAEKYRADVFDILRVRNPTELDRLLRDCDFSIHNGHAT